MKTKLVIFIIKLLFLIVLSKSLNKQQEQIHQEEQLTVISNVENIPNSFINFGDANLNDILKIKILLKQKNLNKLEELFWDTSNPKSENYGKFLNVDEINSIISPDEQDINQVLNWLHFNDIKENEIKNFKDHIEIESNVLKISKLFNTKFSNYLSINTNYKRIRINQSASIPNYIDEKIDFILGLSDFFEKKTNNNNNKNKNNKSINKQIFDENNLIITPKVIKTYYNISLDEISSNSNNLQSIGSFGYYSDGALSDFEIQFNLNKSNVFLNSNSSNCLEDGCDQVEANLDIQYITAIGNNVSTLFYQVDRNGWILDWALDIQSFEPFPLVSSLSYGWSESDQCSVSPESCTKYGLNSLQYINRTNIEFQKIGLRGMSILVSSGDSGSIGFFTASGNCPIDTEYYCPYGGCKHNTTVCPSLTISLVNGSECYFPMGWGTDTCTFLLSNSTFMESLNNFNRLNQNCQAELDYDSKNGPHFYSICSCDTLAPYYDDFSGGLKIVGYQFEPSGGELFDLEFPATSAYVTTVGATKIQSLKEPEIVCSVKTGSNFDTAGGFSKYQSQPYYQQYIVNKYISENRSILPPPYSFNSLNRAIPDITLAGHAFSIFNSNNQSTNQCPCEIDIVDGTSASSPSVAGMISLLNDHLLNSNKSPLGFLNPLLYQLALESPNVFNDITSGNNNCNGFYCCKYGYTAVKGYDGASGLGSINFDQLKNKILKIK